MSRVITLTSGATATSAAPSLADETVGVARPFAMDQAVVCVHSTAGSGTMTVTVRLWGYQLELDRWFDLGPLNNGDAIAETSSADAISHAEGIAGLSAFNRFYAEITAIAGTSTAVTVSMVCRRCDPVTAN